MIFLGADHRGLELKNNLKKWLQTENYRVEDLGAFGYDANDDYPEFAKNVANKVSENPNSRGIVMCGSGVGVDIVANRVEGIRCGLGINEEQIKSARRDDDINILAIASDSTEPEKAKIMIKAFLETDFDRSENHKRRLKEIDQLS